MIMKFTVKFKKCTCPNRWTLKTYDVCDVCVGMVYPDPPKGQKSDDSPAPEGAHN